MKKELLKLVKTVFTPLAIVVTMAAFSPVGALAAGHGFTGGRGGFSGGHSFAAPSRGNFSGGRGFSAPGGARS